MRVLLEREREKQNIIGLHNINLNRLPYFCPSQETKCSKSNTENCTFIYRCYYHTHKCIQQKEGLFGETKKERKQLQCKVEKKGGE